MKFSTREDIDASVEQVFALLCAVEQYERAAMRRGVEVRRHPEPVTLSVGSAWDVNFVMRGKERNITIRIAEMEPRRRMTLEVSGKGYAGRVDFELMALSRSRTRLVVKFEVTPMTLTARLAIQSLRLTKKSLDEKYKIRVASYVKDMQERLSDTA